MKNASRTLVGWEGIAFASLLFFGGIGLFFGWRLFWFLTDDAYIAFRYVSNSILGYGYVWNPPPFMPVEGYTSFLWIVLLDIVWRITGVAPPQSSNVLSFVFSYLTLILCALMVTAVPVSKSVGKRRILTVVFLLVYLLLNRTFLTWASSGLETALFNFFLCAWAGVLLFMRNFIRRIGLGAFLAAALTLTRPDGLLFCAAMLVMVCVEVLRTTSRRDAARVCFCGVLPLGIVLAHQVWRLSFYGEWLPNTYYAKVVSAWPQSGILYALSFTLEYGLWFPIILICWALASFWPEARARATRFLEPGARLKVLRETVTSCGIRFVTLSTLLAHLGYYTFIVGGDHFEYRVYSHTIPLIFLALVWSLNRLQLKPLPFFGLLLGCILVSLPVQWTHWLLSRDRDTRANTHVMRVPIAETWPAPFRFYAGLFDRTQSWLILHHVCMRHQEHKVFCEAQIKNYPDRDEGILVSAEKFPVYAISCVGVAAWSLPNVSVIDLFGLNDYVIARMPLDDIEFRKMAHNRRPPPGYVASFCPNVKIMNRKIYIGKREPPFTQDTIRENEFFWRRRLPEFLENR